MTVLDDLPAADDAEAAAFFADARTALNAQHWKPRVAHVPVDEPDLSNLTGMTVGPEPDRNLISDWVPESFDRYFLAVARKAANAAATRASERQAQQGADGWTTVFTLLAAAEELAPRVDRPWHAARLDAYAAAHGLRGWYRGSRHGKHYVQVNCLRTREMGERERHYVHAAAFMHRPLNHWVVDRDTGRTVYRATSRGIAQQWIDEHERHTT